MTTITKEKLIEHPMEDVLDISPGTTVVEYQEFEPDPIPPAPNYDDKDQDIENKLELVYNAAIGEVSVLNDQIELVEGKFKARLGEVSATMLTVALGALRERSALKMHKDKLAVDQVNAKAPGTVNNNLIVASRNEILQMLADKQKNDTNDNK